MDPRQLFVDERYAAFCTYCGDTPSTTDHVPAKALLDDPLPSNLPVVGSCATCNQGFSRDEEYLAVLLECVICGSVDPDVVSRPKIARKLREAPKLASRVAAARRSLGPLERPLWDVEVGRVEKVMLKLAQGHIAYEFGETCVGQPDSMRLGVFSGLTDGQREAFEAPLPEHIWPEVGSRAFIRACEIGDSEAWRVVQHKRYRYLVALSNGIVVRMVLSEYLYCEVCWW